MAVERDGALPGGSILSPLRSHDIVVSGVGSIDPVACDHFARRAVRVLGLEQFDLSLERGSHHGYPDSMRTKGLLNHSEGCCSLSADSCDTR